MKCPRLWEVQLGGFLPRSAWPRIVQRPLDLISKRKMRKTGPTCRDRDSMWQSPGPSVGTDVIGGSWSIRNHEFLAFLTWESSKSLALASHEPGANPIPPVVAVRPLISPLLLFLSYFPLAQTRHLFCPGSLHSLCWWTAYFPRIPYNISLMNFPTKLHFCLNI